MTNDPQHMHDSPAAADMATDPGPGDAPGDTPGDPSSPEPAAKNRIGVVIVAHGSLAAALLAATEHVVGPQTGISAIAIEPTDDLRERQREINAAVEAVETGAGVILVTDMFGGTPSNLALGAMTRPGIEVIYGANLPLLVKLAKCRRRPLEEAVHHALAAGEKYIDSAARMLEPDPS
ncbi:MAG: PTS sugar transporter subunit IIA [Pseudomonadota bacterium]